MVDHGEFVCQTQQAFGMTHEQVAAGVEAAREFFHQALLLGFIEIHHDVAAEDDIVTLRQVFRFQIVEIEVDEFLERFLDGISLPDFVEIAEAIVVVHRVHVVFGVDAFLARAQDLVIDVAGEDFHFPGQRN